MMKLIVFVSMLGGMFAGSALTFLYCTRQLKDVLRRAKELSDLLEERGE